MILIKSKVMAISYRKVPNFSDTLNVCCNHPKNSNRGISIEKLVKKM